MKLTKQKRKNGKKERNKKKIYLYEKFFDVLPKQIHLEECLIQKIVKQKKLLQNQN